MTKEEFAALCLEQFTLAAALEEAGVAKTHFINSPTQ